MHLPLFIFISIYINSRMKESYLLQTRLQKMPYKHIAAHLRKTELACRLHYHQLSHGSGRRKRTASCSSGGSSEHSPVMPVVPLGHSRESQGRSLSPPGSSSGYVHMSAGGVQLPAIMGGNTPRLPAILPKPMSMGMTQSSSQSMVRTQHSSGEPQTLLPAPPLSRHHSSQEMPTLRLDCAASPMPGAGPNHSVNHVDLSRLHAVYSAHRSSFWSVVAKDYGHNVSPVVLEQAWKTGMCCNSQSSANSPMTPGASPEAEDKVMYGRGQDKTRISSILSMEVEPRTA